jgi:hypothetical protein
LASVFDDVPHSNQWNVSVLLLGLTNPLSVALVSVTADTPGKVASGNPAGVLVGAQAAVVKLKYLPPLLSFATWLNASVDCTSK